MSRVRTPIIDKKIHLLDIVVFALKVTLVVNIVYLVFFLAMRVKDWNKEQDATSSDPSATFAWTLPSTPRSPNETNLPAVPTLHGVAKSNAQNSIAGYDEGSLTLKLRVLIESHPLSLIREELHQKLTSGKIFLNFQPVQGAIAQFKAIPSHEAEAIRLQPGVKMKGILPTLVLDPEWLAELKEKDQIILAFLVLYHEYIHFQQFEKGDETTKKYFASNFLPESEREALHLTQEQACKHMWITELEAYAKECRIANQWGTNVLGDFCLYVDSPIWPQAVFTMFFNSESLDLRFRIACGQAFAKLAGHPNPESFSL